MWLKSYVVKRIVFVDKQVQEIGLAGNSARISANELLNKEREVLAEKDREASQKNES